MSAEPTALLERAHAARSREAWAEARRLYRRALIEMSQTPEVWHNLALCEFALGEFHEAREACGKALLTDRPLWQTNILLGKTLAALGEPVAAETRYLAALQTHPEEGDARIGLADLALNAFGDPLAAIEWVAPLQGHPQHGRDAELTFLMASLYDREMSARALSARLIAFSKRELTLPDKGFSPRSPLRSLPMHRRLRVGLLSPHFSASPVYFLTISFFRQIAPVCELVFFDRGHRRDWATEQFRAIATHWHEVGHLGAAHLAQVIQASEIDELYDLGGWMDPIGLQALSVKPAPRQYKWVGGQSATTGLSSFDGWIGDPWQSPRHFQGLYSEPLVHRGDYYAEYTPPPYLPKPASKKSSTVAIFSNPAKVSRDFLVALSQIPGRKCFIHRQFQYARVRDRIEGVLGRKQVEYIVPENHEEALTALNRFSTMIDTFPYSSGLTACEAVALGTKIHVLKVGELFCERHSVRYAR